MALPKVGSVILCKNIRTGKWEPRYMVLGSRAGFVFVLNNRGEVVPYTASYVMRAIESLVFRQLPA